MSTKIGTTLLNMVTLESLGITEPETSFNPFSAEIVLGDGTTRGMGWGEGDWHWNFLTASQKATLKTYLTGQSSAIYICTRKNDGTFANFAAVAVWTHADNLRSSRTLDFTIRLQRMIEQ